MFGICGPSLTGTTQADTGCTPMAESLATYVLFIGYLENHISGQEMGRHEGHRFIYTRFAHNWEDDILELCPDQIVQQIKR